MKKYLCLIGVLGILLCNTGNSYAQKVAVKTNLLYDATTTMNLGLEIGLGKKWSLDLSGNYNPWKFDDETRLRYWLCEKFNGHFLGLHGHYAKYNVGGMSFLSDNMERHRYQGHLWGGGISYGYQWLLGSRWSMEAVLGVGYARLDHSKYPCATCGSLQKSEKKNYFGPTKAAINILYMVMVAFATVLPGRRK